MHVRHIANIIEIVTMTATEAMTAMLAGSILSGIVFDFRDRSRAFVRYAIIGVDRIVETLV